MAKTMVYEWGSRPYSVDAQIVGDTIQNIAAKNGGRCEPGNLVDAARGEDSPLHPLFTWDDDRAASKWRTHEARKVIGELSVTVVIGGDDVLAPAFISVGHVIATQSKGEGYRPISVVSSDDLFIQEALREATGRIRALKRRYSTIEQLSPLWSALYAIEEVASGTS